MGGPEEWLPPARVQKPAYSPASYAACYIWERCGAFNLRGHFRPLRGACHESIPSMKAFLDCSGSKKKNFLVLSAVAATDNAWGDFADHWKKMLADREPKAPWLHMRQLAHLRGPFKAEHGWDADKAAKLVTDALVYAQHLDKQDFKLFTCSIDMREYRKVEDQGIPLPHYYSLCNRYTAVEVMKWYLAKFHDVFPQELNFYFDQGERFRGFFEYQWVKGKKSGRGLMNHWHLVKTVAPLDAKETPELQLADLCAWACHRSLTTEDAKESTAFHHLSHIAEKILPFRRMPIDATWLLLYATAYKTMPHVLEQLQ